MVRVTIKVQMTQQIHPSLHLKITLYYVFSLEMLDKVDPPTVPDGYGLSLGFYCLMETVKTIQLLVEGVTADSDTAQEKDDKSKAQEKPQSKEDEGTHEKSLR